MAVQVKKTGDRRSPIHPHNKCIAERNKRNDEGCVPYVHTAKMLLHKHILYEKM